MNFSILKRKVIIEAFIEDRVLTRLAEKLLKMV